MKLTEKLRRTIVLGGTAVAGIVSAANADGSLKDAPAPAAEAREFKFSWNAGYSTDYVFRGVSQSAGRPSANGGIDLTYGIAYAGIALSTINFGRDSLTGPSPNKNIARLETDLYVGIKPVVGPVTFDIGAIAYTYPGAVYGSGHTYADTPTYLEGKLGASGDIYKGATVGVTAYYSPEYQFKAGKVATFEGTFAHAFSEMNGITPTFSALVGVQKGNNSGSYVGNFGNGTDNLKYWNAGMTFGFLEKWSLDLRYWDSDLKGKVGGSSFCTASAFQCGQRYLGTIKYTY